MKNTFTLFVFVIVAGSLLFTRQINAQVPYEMSYQAVVRNSDGELVTDQEVGMRVSILRNSIDGPLVYREVYDPIPETNSNGLLTVEIGAGVPLTGKFPEIDWSDGPYFIVTEIDPSGGTTYTITGISQLLSMPYAFYSGTAEILTGEITESQISDLKKYITEETDPLFKASAVADIEPDDIDNWNEAHDWGDHADAGYITQVDAGAGLSGGGTSGSVSLSVDNTVVRTSRDQTIAGTKTFSTRLSLENNVKVTRANTGPANVIAAAYGNVNGDGTLNTDGSTGNFTVERQSAGIYHIIWTDGLNTHFQRAAVAVSIGGMEPRIASWTSIGGGARLVVTIHNLEGSRVDHHFSFVVFKP